MMTACRRWICSLMPLLALAPACATAATLEGTAAYRERIALPPDAVFEATLEEVSRADAPATVLGRATLAPAGAPPFRFRIDYDAAAVHAGHRYTVRATVRHEGRLLFTTDRLTPVLDGRDMPLNLLMKSVPAAEATGATPAPAPVQALEDTYWKLVQLDDKVVQPPADGREPHLVLHGSTRQVAGSAGCNRFMGAYTRDGSTLRFGHLAATMMACPDGTDLEPAMHAALQRVAGWQITGRVLTLSDQAGAPLARFLAVALR